jgi:hypothetical protein
MSDDEDEFDSGNGRQRRSEPGFPNEGADLDDIERHTPVRRKIGSRLSCLSYRIPFINLGPLAVLTHAMELLALIMLTLTPLGLGMAQMPGEWPLIALTAYTCVYAIFAVGMFILKPAPAVVDNQLRRYKERAKSNSEYEQVKEYYKLQLKYAETDSGHFRAGFLWNIFVLIFYTAWYFKVLAPDPVLLWSTNPGGCVGQLALLGMLWVVNHGLLSKYLNKNKIVVSKQIETKVLTITREIDEYERRSRK